MCVSLPAVVLEPGAGGKWRIQSIGGTRAEVICQIESVNPGDYVTVYSGAIVEKLTDKMYFETVALWEEMGKVMQTAGMSLYGNDDL